MAVFEWNDFYGIGIKLIDEQHKQLFNLVNSLHQATKIEKGKELLDSKLKELLEYVFYHFNNEEEIMLRFCYPDFRTHRAEHDSLTKNLLELRSKYNEGKIFIVVELINFFKSWLTIHILQSDMKSAKYIRTIEIFRNLPGVQNDAG
jgi:hemerythrin